MHLGTIQQSVICRQANVPMLAIRASTSREPRLARTVRFEIELLVT